MPRQLLYRVARSFRFGAQWPISAVTVNVSLSRQYLQYLLQYLLRRGANRSHFRRLAKVCRCHSDDVISDVAMQAILSARSFSYTAFSGASAQKSRMLISAHG